MSKRNFNNPQTRAIAALLFAWVTMSAASADTIYVNGSCGDDGWTGLSPVCEEPDGPKESIAAAITVSVDGDTIIMADGTYTGDGNRNLSFGGRNITLRSQNGAKNCIIDCEGAGRFIRFVSGESEQAVLDGLTISNGFFEANGGGMRIINNSNPTVMNCTFTGNSSTIGGAIYCIDSNPSFIDCVFENCGASRGGAIHSTDSNPSFVDCVFKTCNADSLGGAIYSTNSNPSFVDCVFKTCNADSRGGGIYVRRASLTINGCVFQENTAGSNGGAIYASTASVALVDTVFDLNRAESNGAVSIQGGEAEVSACSFIANSATNGGCGGLRVGNGARLDCTDSLFDGNTSDPGGGAGILPNEVHSDSRISRCLFINNVAVGVGAGVGTTRNFPLISDCVFENNDAGEGGGITFRNSNTTRVENVVFLNNTAGYGAGVEVEPGNSPQFVNCLFAGNIATGGGGEFPSAGGAMMVFGSDATPTMVNCTFSDNTSEKFGGAVTVFEDAHLQLVNCVLWGDDAPDGAEIRISYPGFEGGTVTVSYSDVAGGKDGVSIGEGGTLNWGVGNIDKDPLFVDPDNGDYHLDDGSPCIDQGDPAYMWKPGAGRDMDGQMRIWNKIVDMGADEYGSSVFGDTNCDGSIDLVDVEAFVLALLDEDAYGQKYPDCDVNTADTNLDGSVDLSDVEAFIELLLAG